MRASALFFGPTHSITRAILVASVALAVAACDRSGEQTAPQDQTAQEAPAAANESAEGASTAETEPKRFELETSVEAIDGAQTLVARVTPADGLKVNIEFPWSIRFPDDAPAYAGQRFGAEHARAMTEREAVFAIAAPEGEGARTIEGEMRLSVCDETACYTPRTNVRWDLVN